jgi:DNA polymerase (family 10)
MINQELAKILYEIGSYLQANDIAFKPYAYKKASYVLEQLEEDVEGIYKRGGVKELEKISGVGKNIAEKIEEYLRTGKIKYYQDIKKKFPLNLGEILKVEGLGVKKAKVLFEKLKIKNLKDLEQKAKAGKIRSLEGFGIKTEENILKGIAFLKKSKGRFLLAEILPKVKEVVGNFKQLKEVQKIAIAGSVRRRKETIGDIDILVVSKNPKKIMDFFVSQPGIVKIWGNGLKKSSVKMKAGFDIDIRVVPEKSYGAALQYFSGSKEHNIALRKIALEKGLKLNEYGVFRNNKYIAGKTEESVYKMLGLQWIYPEIREDRGEIQAGLKGDLPKLVELRDIKGDLHCHSSWNGGQHSIKAMADMAIFLGYAYLGISDHTKFLRIENGLDEKQLTEQRKEIDKLNSKFNSQNSKFKILQGCEANILNNGSVDIKDSALEKLDYVIAGVHSSLKMPKEEMTNRIIIAMKNPHIDIIAHPTGRLLGKRAAYNLDIEKILRVAKETNTILEINSFPQRLDLNDINIKRAIEIGVKLIINSDAHQTNQMKSMEFGVYQARRGWAEKKNILNTFSLSKLLNHFKQN